jgi:hypothetical protein
MRGGIRVRLWTLVGLVVAGVVVYVAVKTAGGGVKPYTLQETLPKMVSDFGAKARVVQISVSEDNVDFQVIGGDEQLHIRNYDVVESEISSGTTGYNRKVTNFVRAPTSTETSGARVTLGQIDPGVVDRLFHKVGFSRGDSGAILGGSSWVLDSYRGSSDDYVAAVDGSGVHHVDLSSPPAAVTTTQTVPATTSSVTSFSTTFTFSGGSGRSSKLVRCIVGAQGDVNKILKCQERFPP